MSNVTNTQGLSFLKSVSFVYDLQPFTVNNFNQGQKKINFQLRQASDTGRIGITLSCIR